MKQVPDDMKKITDGFLDNVKKAFGDSLISVILYGPAARGEKLKEPYINFLVVVRDNTPSELARCAQFLKQWNRQSITIPLFLNPHYIGQSLDTFPLEFIAISSSYYVVYGEDVLADLAFKPEDVRSQCERELKGKLLHLRAEYLSLRGNTRGLMDLVNRSLNTFRLLFSGVLYLKKHEIPPHTQAMLKAITEAYNLDASLFKKLTAIAKGEIKIDDNEADRLFDLYVEELEKLSNAIDSMALTEEMSKPDKDIGIDKDS